MDPGEWFGLAGLVIGLGSIAINVGVFKSKIAGSERRLDALEAVRDRMGAQLHRARSDVRQIATVMGERLPRRSPTLSNIRDGNEGEDDAAPLAAASEEGST